MTHLKQDREPVSEYRRRAEEMVREHFGVPHGQEGPATPEDFGKMLWELRVRQTELELENEALRASQDRSDAARAHEGAFGDQVPVGLCLLSDEGVILDANLSAARLLGIPREELLQQPWSRYLFEEDRPLFFSLRESLPDTGEPKNCLLRLVNAAGAVLGTHVTVVGTQNADGVRQCRLVFSEISHGSNVNAFPESDVAPFQKIADAMQETLSVLALDGTFLYANQKARHNLLGSGTEAIVGKNLKELIPKEQAAFLIECYQSVYRQGEPLQQELKLDLKSGPAWFFNTLTPINFGNPSVPAVLSVSLDLTEYKRAKQEVAESEERFRRLLQEVPSVAVQGYGRDGTTQYWNKASEFLYGYTAEEAIGRNMLDLIIPAAMRETVANGIDRMIETGVPFPAAPLTLRRKDGSPVDVFSSHTIVQVPGRSPELFCIDVDLTQRKQAEEQLRQRNLLLDGITTMSPAAITIVDSKGIITFANPAAEQLLGLTLDELQQRTFHDPRWSIATADGRPMPEEQLPFNVVRATLKPVVGLEHTIEHPDGRRMLLSVNATPIPDASGALAGVLCVLTDITKRREEENKTRRSEEKFRALFEKSPLGIAYHRMVYDESGRAVDYEFLDANENYRKLTGVDPRGRKVTEAFPGIKQDPFDWVGTFARCAVKGETIRFQQCLQPNQRWYDCVGFQTTPDHFVASFLEITDLKQAEEELRYHLTLLTSMLYSIPDLIFFKTPEGAYLGCNAEFARHVGRPQEDIVGKTDFDLYEPSEAEAFRANDRQMLEQGTVRRNEEWVGYPDGRRILLETLKAPLITPEGDVIGLIGVSRDITKQRQTASQLRLQSLVLDQIQDRVTVTDLEGVITYVNEAEVRGLGFSRETIIGGRTDLYGDDPERGATQRQILEETLQQGEWRGEVVNRTTMGEEVILDCRTQVVLDEQGNRVALAGIATDITERKAMLLALQEHKQLLQGMLEAIPDMVSVHDQDMNILYSNWNGFGGVPEDKRVIGSKCFHTYRGNPDICPDCLAKHALQTNRAIQKELQLPDGRWVDLRIIPMGEGQNKQTLFLEWVRDITESKRSEAERDKLQAQLHQAQKMESVGRLAGGVAHDFNNMLGVILGHIDMALVETDPTSTLHAGLLAVQHAAERSATLTRQLLAFARKQTVSPKVLDLNQTVAGMLQMLHRLIGEDIELQWRPGDSVWPVKIDPSQVDQILANLCVNARDAIADVGKVTIETRNTVLDEAFCAEHEGWVPGDFVLLSLSDNGSGMDSETLSHVFEPFFTTKQQGKGTGLGLATVYGAVKQNKGFISIYSELGLGTTVILYFPRHQGEEERSQQKNDPQPSPRGHEAILLVEDEPAILKMTKMMLERCGYRVLTASTPLEAIRLAGEHGCSLDLLMTDVVMPGMNGRDLANKLLEQYPRMRQLFMSGYTANVIAHHGVLEKGVHFIQKPFSMAELSSKIREVLDLTRDPTA